MSTTPLDRAGPWRFDELPGAGRRPGYRMLPLPKRRWFEHCRPPDLGRRALADHAANRRAAHEQAALDSLRSRFELGCETSAGSGVCRRRPGKRAKPWSHVTQVAACSMARAAR